MHEPTPLRESETIIGNIGPDPKEDTMQFCIREILESAKAFYQRSPGTR